MWRLCRVAAVLPHEFFALGLSPLDAMRFDFSVDIAAQSARAALANDALDSARGRDGARDASVVSAGADIARLIEG